MNSTEKPYLVAVVGAGPAGIYAARQLAQSGARVVLLNRDIKPGGLAEYGIYYDKYRMKSGLRRQFRSILESDDITYYGNVRIGEQGDLSLADLKKAGFQAVLVTVGAQGTKWLGLPGEDLEGVYHAKDLVYHYNRLPPYSVEEFRIGKRVALIGVGNVMLDIAHWLVRDLQVEDVVAVARRGPAEVKFTKAEMEHVASNLDLGDLDDELKRCGPVMEAMNQDIEAAKNFILAGLERADKKISDTCFHFDFLASPSRILGDESGRVRGLEVEETTLELKPDGDTKAVRTGKFRVLDVDSVIFCIGDRVDEDFGLPVKWNEFVKNQHPSYPVEGNSYEAYDPQAEASLEGVFVAGWARKASHGLVGMARKDGENGARAVMQYLKETQSPRPDVYDLLKRFDQRLQSLDHPVVNKSEWRRLEHIEAKIAEEKDVEAYKFRTNTEMLEVLGLVPISSIG